MDFESMFADTMTETVSLREPTGLDAYGGPTYVGATTVVCPAWISRRFREVRTASGEERVSSAEISLGHPTGGGDVPRPSAEVELTLPDGSQPLILAVRSIVDPDADIHTVLVV